MPVNAILDETIDLEMDPASGVIVAKFGNDRGASGTVKRLRDSEEEHAEFLPSGRMVKRIRSVQKVESLTDRLLRTGSITQKMKDAADKFESAFEMLYGSQMSGVSAFYRMPTGGGPSDAVPERLIMAKKRVNAVMAALGGPASLSASCIWFCLGWGETVAEWSRRKRFSGMATISERVAAGVLIGALGILGGSSDDW